MNDLAACFRLLLLLLSLLWLLYTNIKLEHVNRLSLAIMEAQKGFYLHAQVTYTRHN